jgi:osmoprotectant transport system permease protein
MDWAWMGDHLDDLVARLIQHLYLTAIAIAVGFAISFLLAVWSVRRRRVYAPITAAAGILYTIPSLALFAALVPITGLSLLTAEIPLVLYTLLILVRNIVAGFDSVPRDVLEAADGMGYRSMERLRRVELPLAMPLVVAGLRVACVSTIGLVAITGAIGDRFGGLGFFIFEGWRHFFPTEMVFGAVPAMLLAIAVDLSLVFAQGRARPWARAGGAAGPGGAGGDDRSPRGADPTGGEVQPLRGPGEATA